MSRGIVILFICIVFPSFSFGQEVYEVDNGKVHFSSSARHELISAQSKELKGALDTRKKTFAFKMPIASFKGFNSPLQREHFNENYMETERYNYATFTGKIIENVAFDKEGEYTVRAKGKLNIHGMEQERIIDVQIVSKANKLIFRASFIVSLIDHNIKIPRVVYDKLAPDIKVKVSGSLLAAKQ